MPYDILQLNDMPLADLVEVASDIHIGNAISYEKQKLISKILDKQAALERSTEDPLKKKRGRKPREQAAETVVEAGTAIPAAVPAPENALKETTPDSTEPVNSQEPQATNFSENVVDPIVVVTEIPKESEVVEIKSTVTDEAQGSDSYNERRRRARRPREENGGHRVIVP